MTPSMETVLEAWLLGEEDAVSPIPRTKPSVVSVILVTGATIYPVAIERLTDGTWVFWQEVTTPQPPMAVQPVLQEIRIQEEHIMAVVQVRDDYNFALANG